MQMLLLFMLRCSMSVHLGRSGDKKYPWGSAKYPLKYPCGYLEVAPKTTTLEAI